LRNAAVDGDNFHRVDSCTDGHVNALLSESFRVDHFRICLLPNVTQFVKQPSYHHDTDFAAK